MGAGLTSEAGVSALALLLASGVVGGAVVDVLGAVVVSVCWVDVLGGGSALPVVVGSEVVAAEPGRELWAAEVGERPAMMPGRPMPSRIALTRASDAAQSQFGRELSAAPIIAGSIGQFACAGYRPRVA